MKKILSITLAAVMLLSMIPAAFAAEIGGNWNGGTAVVYGDDADEINAGAGTEAYTVTVPASMNPGDNATVSAEGTLPATKKLVVTTADSVVLSYSGSEKTLAVTGGDLIMAGSNIEAVSASAAIAVADWSDEVKAPLFGEWAGTITYTAEVVANS